MRTFISKLRNNKGGVFEFVLILPIVTFLILMLLIYGKIVYVKMAAEMAAREAARTYAVYHAEADAVSKTKSVALEEFRNALPVNTSSVQVTIQEGYIRTGSGGNTYFQEGTPRDYCRVEVTVDVPIEAPYFHYLLGSNKVVGTKKGNSYVKEVRADAVFYKEAVGFN